MKLLPFKKQIREKNLIKYKGKPPSMELINSCVAKMAEGRKLFGRTTFERIYGIPLKTIERYYKGLRGMPLDYWHIFYEFDDLEKFYATFKLKKKRDIKKEVHKELPAIALKNKSIIDAYRERINQRDS
jgi:hypothetical protein